MKKGFCVFLSMLFWISILHAHPFPYIPPVNFTLKPEYIALHHPVTTKNVSAQMYFDQGLTFIYAFNHDAAYWSFLRAKELDPDMPMAYWGMALALGQNINMDIDADRQKTAFGHIQKALSLLTSVTEPESDYVKALATRYTDEPNPNLPKLAKDYNLAMINLSKKYPDDPDAQVLTSESYLDLSPWKNWTNDGSPLPGTQEAIDLLESILERIPDHLGANHYYIHILEASKHPERALMSAERLRKLLPSSGHILHMPSHIYLLVGDYYRAAMANEEAAAIDKQYIREYGLDGIYPLHYLSHNLYFMGRAYSMAGNLANALRASKELENLYWPFYDHMPELEYYIPSSLFVNLRFHQWENVLHFPKPLDRMIVTTVLWHFARAIAWASLGDLKKALDEKRLFDETRGKVSVNMTYGYNKAEKLVQIAEHVLNAKIALAENKPQEAVLHYELAIGVQDQLSYNEPPDWFFPVRESLGGLLLLNQHYEKAEKIFREELKIHPKNGRALYGLSEALKGQNKHYDYFWTSQEFQKVWLYSDVTLTPQLL